MTTCVVNRDDELTSKSLLQNHCQINFTCVIRKELNQ